jgi:excisionase family DNA binding protein
LTKLVHTGNSTIASDAPYMSAEEAARALEVTVPTLYAYVSRKQIRSERIAGSRARRYWRADIERLRGGEAAAAPGSGTTSLCAESAITLITDGGSIFAVRTPSRWLNTLAWSGGSGCSRTRPSH